jgi:hypothetical protein
MLINDVILLILVIVLGLAALNVLGDPRFKEGFANQEAYFEHSSLNPDVVEVGPNHLLQSELDNTRPYNVTGTLTNQRCYEQDGHRVPEKLGDYTQRTNNYKHTYPDSCSAPFKELVGSFYTPREGSIGSPVPIGSRMPRSTQCL